MRLVLPILVTIQLLVPAIGASAQALTAAGEPAVLEVRRAGDQSVRVTLRPVSTTPAVLATPILAADELPAPVLRLDRLPEGPVRQAVGALDVEVRSDPLTVVVRAGDRVVQTLVFHDDGRLTFDVDDSPVLGLGGGGPRPERGEDWREQAVEYDRRGRYHEMAPRWQSDMYGSRNPVAMLVGTGGWGLFVAQPWVEVDLRDEARGAFVPWAPPPGAGAQDRRNQHEQLGKGRHPVDRIVPGLYDVFVFDGRDPAGLLRDFSRLTGPAALPPKWALGYMQSHRTLEDDAQLLEVIDTFREKRIPLDAVIYLGTGFCPRGWNTEQPSFTFNPEVFRRDPRDVLADMAARRVRTAVHIVPWDRDRLPTLYGSIPPGPDESVDDGHILRYWREHVPLMEAGVDAFWPDEGDWFDLYERLKRHQLYYQGPLHTRPDVRPWHLQRNGHAGIARWGGWVWSGDTESAWKTLEAQIAVGLNYSLSVGPYWGSDIGGFYANRELTGELYARWFQFGAFSGSFRSHGRTWWTRLPWGWGLDEMGPKEVNNTNTVRTEADRRRRPSESELGNPAIEPVVQKYAELRYRLLPYTYTLAWEARARGLPLMRPLWLHYPEDARARRTGDSYLWGRDLLVAPVYEPGARSRDVYLPDGTWYDWWTRDRVEGGRVLTRPVDLSTLPIYVRAGAIIPTDPVRQYTAQEVDGNTTLRVWTGADGAFTLYHDDGIRQDYLAGEGSWTRITWDDDRRTLTIEPDPPAGARDRTGPRTFNVLL
ncbi:MAG: TIM-barrel domain-containing protein, partial [Gemmatimonadota bacterium]